MTSAKSESIKKSRPYKQVFGSGNSVTTPIAAAAAAAATVTSATPSATPSAPPRSRQSYPVRQIYGGDVSSRSSGRAGSLYSAPSMPSLTTTGGAVRSRRTDSVSPGRLRSAPAKKVISLVPSEDGGPRFCLVTAAGSSGSKSSDSCSAEAARTGAAAMSPQLGKYIVVSTFLL